MHSKFTRKRELLCILVALTTCLPMAPALARKKTPPAATTDSGVTATPDQTTDGIGNSATGSLEQNSATGNGGTFAPGSLTNPTSTVTPNPFNSLVPTTNAIQSGEPHTEFLDLTSGKFDKLDLELTNAVFSNAGVDRLHISAANMDFKEGMLKSLAIEVYGAKFSEIVFDQLALNTTGDMKFDPATLLGDKILQFAVPIEANVVAVVNQDTLNTFLNSPATLQRLSVTANKRVGMIASMLGANAANFGITLSDASVILQKDNRISIATKANVGMGGIGVPLPLELNAKLSLANGWVEVSDTHLNTNGQEISPQLSEMLVKKMNGLASWGSKSEDIQFSFTDLKVIPGKQFMMRGTARISRLRFGKQPKEAVQ